MHRLRAELLKDGKITEDEVEVIRRHIQEHGRLDLEDVRFLVELREEAEEVTPEFEALCREAMASHPRNWNVGGR